MSGKSSRPPVAVNTELRDVFTPLCMAAAKAAEPEAIAASQPELFEDVDNLSMHILPNDDMYIQLPWDVALEADLSKWSTLWADYEAVNSEKGVSSKESRQASDKFYLFIEELKKKYAQRHPEVSKNTLRSIDYKIDRWFDNDRINKGVFDAEAWKKYEQQVAQLNPAEQTEIESFSNLRRNNVGKARCFSDSMQRSGHSVFAHNRYAHSQDLTSNLAVPVGEYGIEFAQRNISATALMQAAAYTNVRELARQVTEGHEDTLQKYTARAAGKPEPTAETTMDSLQEGILSVMQSVAILTQEKVEGYDDPIALLEDIVKSGLIERLARYTPMGFVGPMALSGKYCQNSLVRTNDGLAFSEGFEDYLKEKRDEYVKMVEKVAERDDSKSVLQDISQPIGRVCPVSGKGGGIQALANTYLELVKSAHLSKELTGTTLTTETIGTTGPAAEQAVIADLSKAPDVSQGVGHKR